MKNGKELELDKKLTPELKREGYARDLIRAIQAARKHAGFKMEDRIKLSLSVDVPENYVELVQNEVLADKIDQNEDYAYDEIAKINGENITISLEKAA